jgi:hypothetical protein
VVNLVVNLVVALQLGDKISLKDNFLLSKTTLLLNLVVDQAVVNYKKD